MMTKPNDGGPAYPQSIHPDGPFGGLTKREAFAMAAMQGLLAGGWGDSVPHDDVAATSDAAAFSVMYADALLAELNKE